MIYTLLLFIEGHRVPVSSSMPHLWRWEDCPVSSLWLLSACFTDDPNYSKNFCFLCTKYGWSLSWKWAPNGLSYWFSSYLISYYYFSGFSQGKPQEAEWLLILSYLQLSSAPYIGPVELKKYMYSFVSPRSLLQHAGSSTFILACGIF